MSVLFIGSKRVGKTTLLVELANNCSSKDCSSENSFVEVIAPSYQELIQDFYAEIIVQDINGNQRNIVQAIATPEKKEIENLQIKVKLPSGDRILNVKCVDSPGEFWTNIFAQKSEINLQGRWQTQLIKDLKTVQGILLILAPPRTKLIDQYLRRNNISRQEERFLDENIWLSQVENWLNFLAKNTSNYQQILICLNMADLFCNDHQQEAEKLRYTIGERIDPNLMDWHDRCQYILNKYFDNVKHLIDDYNIETDGNHLQTFITTKENRSLLELPWLYLASYLRG